MRTSEDPLSSSTKSSKDRSGQTPHRCDNICGVFPRRPPMKNHGKSFGVVSTMVLLHFSPFHVEEHCRRWLVFFAPKKTFRIPLKPSAMKENVQSITNFAPSIFEGQVAEGLRQCRFEVILNNARYHLHSIETQPQRSRWRRRTLEQHDEQVRIPLHNSEEEVPGLDSHRAHGHVHDMLDRIVFFLLQAPAGSKDT